MRFTRKIAYLALFIIIANSPTISAAQTIPPNILFILADDMGLNTSHCHPEWGDEMPHLEELCRDGLVFDNVCASPTCSPTWASILTGKYSIRTRIGTAVIPRSANPVIKLSELYPGQYLDQKSPHGYAHAIVGSGISQITRMEEVKPRPEWG